MRRDLRSWSLTEGSGHVGAATVVDAPAHRAPKPRRGPRASRIDGPRTLIVEPQSERRSARTQNLPALRPHSRCGRVGAPCNQRLQPLRRNCWGKPSAGRLTLSRRAKVAAGTSSVAAWSVSASCAALRARTMGMWAFEAARSHATASEEGAQPSSIEASTKAPATTRVASPPYCSTWVTPPEATRPSDFGGEVLPVSAPPAGADRSRPLMPRRPANGTNSRSALL